jgi:hypothetical protein
VLWTQPWLTVKQSKKFTTSRDDKVKAALHVGIGGVGWTEPTTTLEPPLLSTTWSRPVLDWVQKLEWYSAVPENCQGLLSSSTGLRMKLMAKLSGALLSGFATPREPD